MASSPTDNPVFPFTIPINKDGYPFNDGIEFTFNNDYYWIVVAGCIFGFITAYGIGANDVANAFATSVGAKSLTVVQAVIIAAIFEFSGAVLLGSAVTDTVRKGIVDYEAFYARPDYLMCGMLAAIIAVGAWLFLATAFELPVSTTHSIVGGIIGFALCTPGANDAVNWSKVGMIVVSWVASPALSGIFAASLFLIVRTTVLRKEDSFHRCLKMFPILVGLTVWINVIFIIYKGGKGKGWNKGIFENIGVGIGVGLAVGVAVGIIIVFTVVPMMKKNLEHLSDDPAGVEAVTEAEEVDAEKQLPSAVVEHDDQQAPAKVESQKSVVGKDDVEVSHESHFQRATNVHKAIDTDAKVSSIHEAAEKFPYRTERAFMYLQVFTAIFDSFSHGANDVANSVGPLAAIVAVYEAGEVTEKKVAVPIWILALGGAGIVVGLATYGYKIMSALGVKMIKVTPTRGFAIELGAAVVIAVGSFIGIPLSTTHCQVGATVGVGLCDGYKTAVNWWLLLKVVTGWLITLVVAGCTTALIFAYALYSPNVEPPLSVSSCLNVHGTFLNGTEASFNLTSNTTYLIGLEDRTLL